MSFFDWEVNGELVGTIGFEPIKDVTLIRHSYVLPRWQKQGIGSKLLNHIKGLVTTPYLLVGPGRVPTYTPHTPSSLIPTSFTGSSLLVKSSSLPTYTLT